MTLPNERVAVITGASAGIGAATARALAKQGFHIVAGARRIDKVEALCREIGGTARTLDVTSEQSVAAFVAGLERVDVLVNNAGLSRGLDPLERSAESHWREMWETNVMGLVHMTRALLPALSRAPFGHIVNLGSVAAFEVYVGGAGYTASKHAVMAITKTLRLELLGRPIRITEVDPGLVETEFSLVRFDGDPERAKKPYTGIEPLVADDIADCIAWAVSRPAHVNIDQIVVRPVTQATASIVARKT